MDSIIGEVARTSLKPQRRAGNHERAQRPEVYIGQPVSPKVINGWGTTTYTHVDRSMNVKLNLHIDAVVEMLRGMPWTRGDIKNTAHQV